MLKEVGPNAIEGIMPASDCEKNLMVKWLTGTPTCSFYIGDKESQKLYMQSFLNGKVKCYIDSKSYFSYLEDIKEIILKFNDMFYGPFDVIENAEKHFKSLAEEDRYIFISYIYPERYLKTSKHDINVDEFKSSLAANITKIRIEKESNSSYKMYVYLIDNWRELIMNKSSKCNNEALTSIFNDFFLKGISNGQNCDDLARLFGIKYCDLIKNNNLNIVDIVAKSNFNSESLLDCVKNGMLLSKDILWESKNDYSNEEFNVYGIHIKNQNSALDNTYPHICIGWSKLGDITGISNKEELKQLYVQKWPNDSNVAIGINVGQIWLFKNEIMVGDYIVFFDNGNAHFGKVAGDFEYKSNVNNQSNDYAYNRKVEWIKDIKYADLPEEYRKSSMVRRSVYKLDTYTSLIKQIINGEEIVKDEFDDEIDPSINLNDYLEQYDYSSSCKSGINLIVYGTPGCGKSYYVKNELLPKYGSDSNGIPSIRTTFYQDYTNTDFVGQIMPVVKTDGSITYEFNPGPFTLALNQAIQNPDKPIALVIEELNRGNAASIFGDIFQL